MRTLGEMLGRVRQGRKRWRRKREELQRFVEEQLRMNQATWVPSLFNPRGAFRFLWAGILLMVLAGLVGVVAINTNTGLLFMVLGLLLGAWLVSGAISTINLDGISIERRVSTTSQVGEKLIITYRVTNHKRLFRSFGLMLEEVGHLPMFLPAGYIPTLGPGESTLCTVMLTCRRRGYMRLRQIRLSSRFPFGLIAKSLLYRKAADVIVHPSIGSIRQHILNRISPAGSAIGQYNQQTKGFEEFYGLREFQSYDNYHWIHWRSSAKSDRLMVKEMAEYNSNHITILLDTRVENPLSLDQQQKLEEAISFAATLIDRATERCLPVALVVSGGDMKVVNHGRGAGHRWSLMTELANVQMGHWDGVLPSLGSFRPRSFAEGHYWVVGVNVQQHLDKVEGLGRNVTVVDVDTPHFQALFTHELGRPDWFGGKKDTTGEQDEATEAVS